MNGGLAVNREPPVVLCLLVVFLGDVDAGDAVQVRESSDKH